MNDATVTPRDRPIAPELDVETGRDMYLRENGFTVEAYDSPWTPASLFGIPFSVPNPPRHRRAIMLHDLHHVATGFGTDIVGEAEISAWELRHGLGGLGLYVGFLVTGLALLGLAFSPRRVLRAFRLGGRGTSLFKVHRGYHELLTMSVGELREALGIPPEGLASAPRGLHGRAPQGV